LADWYWPRSGYFVLEDIAVALFGPQEKQTLSLSLTHTNNNMC